MDILFTLLIMLGLLLLKGFFSGSEIALVSTDKMKLRLRAAEGNKGAALAENMLKRPERLLSTTLLGTNIASIALTTIGTVMMVSLFPENGEMLAFIIFTPLFLIFGEIVPKSVYQQRANRLAPIIIYPLSWLQTLLMPLIWLLSKIAQGVARLLGGTAQHLESEREQLMAMVNLAETSADNVAFARGQVRRVLQFAQLTAGEVMWNLNEGQALPVNTSMLDMMTVRQQTGQRLIPLYDNGPRDVVKVVCLDAWDLMNPELKSTSPNTLERPIEFVLAIQPVSDVFDLLHKDTGKVVVVVDESGDAVGLITIQGLIRRSLGSEQSGVTVNKDQPLWQAPQPTDDGKYLIDARTPIAVVNEVLNTDLSSLNYSTIGALSTSHFRHIPQQGEQFSADGYIFEVSEAHQRSVTTLLAYKN